MRCEHKRYSIKRRYRFDLVSPVERANATGDTVVPIETQKVCDDCGELWTQIDSEPPKRDTIPCPAPVTEDQLMRKFDEVFAEHRPAWFDTLGPNAQALVKEAMRWGFRVGWHIRDDRDALFSALRGE